MTRNKRVLVTVDDDLYNLISNIKGMGNSDSEKLANIARSWLSEKSVISTQLKKKLKLE